MSTINYKFARHTQRIFAEGDIKNPAQRAMYFVNFEYKAGGEPVFRGTKENKHSVPAGRAFLAARKREQTRRRIRVARKQGKSIFQAGFQSKMSRKEHAERVGRLIAGRRIKPA